jgi:hypothetical protein
MQPRDTYKFNDLLEKSLLLHQQGRLDEARVILEHLTSKQDKHPQVFYLLGIIAAQQGDFLLAEEKIQNAIQQAPSNSIYYLNLAHVLQSMDKQEAAADAYSQAIQLNPSDATAYFYRGITLSALNRHDEAIASLNESIRIQPNHAQSHFALGNVLQTLSQYANSVDCYCKAIELNPCYAEALSNLGCALHQLKRYTEALHAFDQAISLNPQLADAYLNRGNTLQECVRFEEAVSDYEHAIRLKPDFALAHNNRGNAQHELLRLDEATASYHQALHIEPNLAETRWNLALSYLLLGNYETGWRYFESRWHYHQSGLRLPQLSPSLVENAPRSLSNLKILVHAEQGLGDTIQFCRFLVCLQSCGATVYFDAQSALGSVFKTLAGVDAYIERDKTLPDFDFHCPLLSLPLILNTTIDTIPYSAGYLQSDPRKVNEWSERLGSKKRPRIGLVWSGNPNFKNDHLRSLTLDLLLPYLPVQFDYFCLQKELRKNDSQLIKNSKIQFLGDEIVDFSDTAALCSLMDLVISSDTSVAHLAGALGKKTWMLLSYVPDWRWHLGRSDSPWYDSMKLYRQSADRSWTTVIERIVQDLAQEFLK